MAIDPFRPISQPRIAMKRILWLFGFVLISCLAPSERALAQNAPLFEADDVLDLTLRADWPALLGDRGDEAEELPASLSYTADDGSTVTQEIEVRLRGNFRRQAQICTFPPLRLDIAGKAAKGTLFEGQDKLKLVTHCQNRRASYEQLVLLEYLIYRAYSQLTDLSFRVRLLKITYEDPSGDWKPLTRYGFLIEDEDAMATRNGGTISERVGLHQDLTDDRLITMLSIFQFMIGNTDWSVPALHNIVLIETTEHSRPVAVPYDFDFSGLIDAPYASPGAGLPIKSVRERLYRGFCRSEETLTPVIEQFLVNQDAIHALFNKSQLLRKRYRKQAVAYLTAFNEILSTPLRLRRALVASCRRSD